MQRGRVEVRAVRPNQRMHFRIDAEAVEQLQIAEGTVQFARQNRLEIDDALRRVVKAETHNVRSDDFGETNSINRMSHKNRLSQWIDRRGPATFLQPIPISLQFRLMQLRPRFHQSPRPRSERARDHRDRINAEDTNLFLTVSVEVSGMMWCSA